MQQKFTPLNNETLTIDNNLIEPFDFSKEAETHYTISDGFHIKAFVPKGLIDSEDYDRSIPFELFHQSRTYNQLMYNPVIFRKLLEYQTEILKRPEYFLLRLPALFINHEHKAANTSFTLGSLLESWQFKRDLYSVDEEGELLLMSVLYPRPSGFCFRAWSPDKKAFREIGISGSTENIIEEFEQLNKRYPVQLRENYVFAIRLLAELN